MKFIINLEKYVSSTYNKWFNLLPCNSFKNQETEKIWLKILISK